MNKVSRMGLRPPAMLARFMDEPLLQVIGATPTRAAILRRSSAPISGRRARII